MHGSLKERGCIGESEIHDTGHVGALRRFERRLVLIFFRNSDVIVSPPYVKFGEESFPVESFQGCLDVWQRVIIPDRILVDLLIVHDDAFFLAVLFVDKVNWGGVG